MPFITPQFHYLNPYKCDVCGSGVGLSGLVESGWERVKNQPSKSIWGHILCEKHIQYGGITHEEN